MVYPSLLVVGLLLVGRVQLLVPDQAVRRPGRARFASSQQVFGLAGWLTRNCSMAQFRYNESDEEGSCGSSFALQLPDYQQ